MKTMELTQSSRDSDIRVPAYELEPNAAMAAAPALAPFDTRPFAKRLAPLGAGSRE